jgi:hypothetical protein
MNLFGLSTKKTEQTGCKIVPNQVLNTQIESLSVTPERRDEKEALLTAGQRPEIYSKKKEGSRTRHDLGLDLAQLYAVASQLDHVVHPAEQVEAAAVREPARQVTRAVHPAPVKWVGNELLPGRFLPIGGKCIISFVFLQNY